MHRLDLSDWYFFTEADPTGGQVKFLGADDAKNNKLAYVQEDGTAVITVDDYTSLAAGAPRNSVRITSKEQWSTGLFIADLYDVPHGCGTWPAYWTVGPNWPLGGEIDVL
jgi:beta-glucanase (GH16 family)